MRDVPGPVQVKPQRAVINLHMQLIAVYYNAIYCDTLLISLHKSGLDIWTYDDFMKSINRTCLGMAGKTQKNEPGLLTSGIKKRIAAPIRWHNPNNRSAFIHLSAIMPVIVGINIAEIPIVEKIAPNSAPPHCLSWNQ